MNHKVEVRTHFVMCLCQILTLVFFASIARTQPLPSGRLHIKVFGPFGAPISNCSISVLGQDSKRVDMTQCPDATLVNLPYGRYLVRADAAGHRAERSVTINLPETWIRMGLVIVFGDRLWPGGSLAVKGTITPAPTNPENWWVRAEGVFLNESRESPVKKDGAYSVGGLEMGAYLVQVFEGASLRSVKMIELDGNRPVLDLPISIQRGEGADVR
jgi:hypothetical protein